MDNETKTKIPLLRAQQITKAFAGNPALRGVDFEVAAGEVVCLAGENGCGKSTLVKIISGVYQQDSGTIEIAGKHLDIGNPRAAIEAGVQVIYQDLALFDHLSVEENIAFSTMMSARGTLVNRSQRSQVAREQLEKIGVELDLSAPLSSLSIANKQVVAICRALSMNAKVIFMDEPTTSLTSNEVDRLLAIVLDLKRQGLSVVFISHKLDEVFRIADRITILRDGAKVGDFEASQLDSKSLSQYMTGREVTYTRYARQGGEDTALLELKGLERNGHYQGINLKVRPGDIVGITGLIGSGRTELALSIFGLNPPTGGQILVANQPVEITGPWVALRHGIALLPEDRKTQSLFLRQAVRQNISSAALGQVLDRLGNISPSHESDLAQEMVEQLKVNNRDISLPVGNLSGGNQQKVVIGKWMAASPKLLILDSPTVGIDIGSKDEIYGAIQELARQGMGIILISDEAEEISANCNQVLVMNSGTIVEQFREKDMRAANFAERLARIIANPVAIQASVHARSYEKTAPASAQSLAGKE